MQVNRQWRRFMTSCKFLFFLVFSCFQCIFFFLCILVVNFIEYLNLWKLEKSRSRWYIEYNGIIKHGTVLKVLGNWRRIKGHIINQVLPLVLVNTMICQPIKYEFNLGLWPHKISYLMPSFTSSKVVFCLFTKFRGNLKLLVFMV